MMRIDDCQVKLDADRALLEDVGSGDVSAALLAPSLVVKAEIINREPLLLCGQAWVNAVFAAINPHLTVRWMKQEGEFVEDLTTLAIIEGKAGDILTAERSALNFLQTLSATATQTYQFVQQVKNTSARILDTRKTLPGLRYAQKYAVRTAGGMNHRMGLYDAYLIKENHIIACGSITAAIEKARTAHKNLFIEIEVETLAELEEAVVCKPDRILLDNFTLSNLKKAVAINKNYASTLEASGGVSLTTVAKIAATGVDFISVGAITKSINAIDLSLLIRTLL